jgi:hypothetical protein
MRRRIYWLLPDLASAEKVRDDLLLARIEAGHLHFIARDDIELTGLPNANVLQTSDVVRSAQLGLVVGGLGGAVVGICAGLFVPMEGTISQLGLAAVLAVLGALFGAWASSMIGVSVPSHRLERFTKAIAEGQILLLADVPSGRVEEIEERLLALHPEAHLEGVEPNIPAFP